MSVAYELERVRAHTSSSVRAQVQGARVQALTRKSSYANDGRVRARTRPSATAFEGGHRHPSHYRVFEARRLLFFAASVRDGSFRLGRHPSPPDLVRCCWGSASPRSMSLPPSTERFHPLPERRRRCVEARLRQCADILCRRLDADTPQCAVPVSYSDAPSPS